MKKNKIDGEGLPRHVAVIMDGNGRWAKRRLMPRSFGHQQGMNRMIGLLEHAFDIGIEYVTVYALSTENLLPPIFSRTFLQSVPAFPEAFPILFYRRILPFGRCIFNRIYKKIITFSRINVKETVRKK